jgi:hypothetical protein
MFYLERLCKVRVSPPQAFCLYQQSFILSTYHHIKRYARRNGVFLQSFKGHTKTVCSLFVWKDYLFASGLDGQLLQWHIPTGDLVGHFYGQPNPARGFQVVKDSLLYTIHDKQQVLQWSLDTKRMLRCQTFPTVSKLLLHSQGSLDSSYLELQTPGLVRYCVTTGVCVPVCQKPERLLSPLLSVEALDQVLWGATRHGVWQGELQQGGATALWTETPVPDIIGLSRRTLFRYTQGRLYVYQIWDERLLQKVLPTMYEDLWVLVMGYVY